MGGASTLRKTGARLSSTMPRKSFPAAREAVPAKPLRRKQKMTPEEMERERRLREEIESRRAAQELQKLQVQKDQYELRKLESLQKSLRGRDYDTTTTASSSWLISSIQTRCQASLRP